MLFMALNTIKPLKQRKRERKVVAVVGIRGVVRGTTFFNGNRKF
jgi:hypothetical protein